MLQIELDEVIEVIKKSASERGALTYFLFYVRVDQDRLGFKDQQALLDLLVQKVCQEQKVREEQWAPLDHLDTKASRYFQQ